MAEGEPADDAPSVGDAPRSELLSLGLDSPAFGLGRPAEGRPDVEGPRLGKAARGAGEFSDLVARFSAAGFSAAGLSPVDGKPVDGKPEFVPAGTGVVGNPLAAKPAPIPTPLDRESPDTGAPPIRGTLGNPAAGAAPTSEPAPAPVPGPVAARLPIFSFPDGPVGRLGVGRPAGRGPGKRLASPPESPPVARPGSESMEGGGDAGTPPPDDKAGMLGFEESPVAPGPEPPRASAWF